MSSAASDPTKEPLPPAEAPQPRGPNPDTGPDAEQETDVWWGSYAGRAMLPSFLVCGLLSVAIALGAWYIADAFPDMPYPPRYLAYVLTALVWLVQMLRWGYRTVTINYRLTTRRLFRDDGFTKPSRVVELARIKSVAVHQVGPLECVLGIGRLRIDAEEAQPLVLDAVRQPEAVAEQIRAAAARARARQSGTARASS